MSGLDFLLLVLQSSNSFDHKLFFKFHFIYCLLRLRVQIFRQLEVQQGFFALLFNILVLNFIVFPFCSCCCSLWLISLGKMKLPGVANLLMEKMFNVFSDKPALKLGQQFTGTAVETTSPIFPVKSR